MPDQIYFREFHPVYVVRNPYRSTITIIEKRFKRHVYRPINGHDILIDQIQIDEPQPNLLNIESERYEGASKEELIRLISYDLYDLDNNRNWTPNATKIADFVSNSQLEMENFTLIAEEGVGTLHVMGGEFWWDVYGADCEPQRTSDPCSCCMEALPDDASKLLGRKCGHVFHKDCLVSWIWKDERCPNCRSGFAGEED